MLTNTNNIYIAIAIAIVIYMIYTTQISQLQTCIQKRKYKYCSTCIYTSDSTLSGFKISVADVFLFKWDGDTDL